MSLHLVFLLAVLKQQNSSAIVLHAGPQLKPEGLLCNSIADGISLIPISKQCFCGGVTFRRCMKNIIQGCQHGFLSRAIYEA